jgi:hypothetical protein
MKLFVRVSLVSLIVMALLVSTSLALDSSRLLLYWACNEGSGDMLTDGSGNGWDATIQDGAHEWVNGKYGGGIRLQKACGIVEGDVISSTGQTGEITIACWINIAAHTTYNGFVSIANPACEASCCYRLMINPSKNPFWNAGHHVDNSLADFTFSLDTWYHYALVADSVVDRIYVDGASIGEAEENFPLPEFLEVSVYLGAGESPGTWPAEDCAFDDVMIWDKALTEDEVNTIMGGGITAVAPSGKLAATWAGMKSE